MMFHSTNQKVQNVAAREAILQGLAADGGLFMPDSLPTLGEHFISQLPGLSLPEIGTHIASLFLKDQVSPTVLRSICEDAFSFPCPVIPIEENSFVLELFHGPTLAFKDFGARFMSRLVAHFLSQESQEATVLVATSGDTGSAVAHGFYRVAGTRVVLLYPEGMVSPIQEQQLTTLGENITALRVAGTFDDCQHLVKTAFVDQEVRDKLRLISANSINFARLLPQSFYYFFAYSQLAGKHRPLVFSVPSGNFGNLTAGLLAKRMGLPIERFIASVNRNDTFVRFMESSHYQPRPSVSTLSNAMDVGNPSNFARMLELFPQGADSMAKEIATASYSDEETIAAIKHVFKECDYVLDPHTAVGYCGLRRFVTGSELGVVLSTAHPAKFKSTVEQAIGREIPLPKALADCQTKPCLAMGLSNDYAVFRELLLGLE